MIRKIITIICTILIVASLFINNQKEIVSNLFINNQKEIVSNTVSSEAFIYSTPSALIKLHNIEREKIGLPLFKVDERLNRSAKAKCDDMEKKGYWGHKSPDGITPWYWIKKEGYIYQRAGENLATDWWSNVEVMKAWMNSKTHKKNILNPVFLDIGVGECGENTKVVHFGTLEN